MKNKPMNFKSHVKKDAFFQKSNKKISNKTNEYDKTNCSEKQDVNNQSQNSSGSFFISASEKVKIIEERNRVNKQKLTRNSHNTNRFEENKSWSSGNKDVNLVDNRKQFDKKKWRFKKYSKKYKLEQWEEKRKKSLIREYYKQVKNDGPKVNVNAIYEKYSNEENSDFENSESKIPNEISGETENNNFNTNVNEANTVINKKGVKALERRPTSTQLRLQKAKEEKERKKEEKLKRIAEKEAALKEYKKRKLEKYKKLSKRTKKGQPIMKYRMEMLLEQIEKSVNE